MDWVKGFQRSLDYIEDHITEPLDAGDIAEQMNISAFYYQKIFTIICGFTLGEYIRSRRLTLAGQELAGGGKKIIDTAMKYGYNTPEGFTRAFTAFYGATPTAVKKGSTVRIFARLSVKISVKGGSIMDCKIVKKKSFKVLEKRMECSVNMEHGETDNAIPEFWEKCQSDGTLEKLHSLTCDKTNIFGICYAHTYEKSQTFIYSIGAEISGDVQIPDGFSVNEIPERTWAVFECTGAMPAAIRELWHRICTDFFPSSGYEPTYEMDIEVYTEGDMEDKDYKSQIWVPVKG